jgi:hypothetical protein
MKPLRRHSLRLMALFCFLVGASLASESVPLQSHFECAAQDSGGYRPYYLHAINNGTAYQDYSQTSHGLLGQNAMSSLEECSQALASANNEDGVICSRTGLDGWKPTLYTGTSPGRPDFGYLGGSTITQFSDCLKATKDSSKKGVCFWGGSDWYISPIDHEGLSGGPFHSLEECVSHTV